MVSDTPPPKPYTVAEAKAELDETLKNDACRARLRKLVQDHKTAKLLESDIQRANEEESSWTS